MRFFTSVYFVILLCLLGILLAVFLAKEIIRILTINKIREGKNKGASYICDLLCERFPDATVYKNVRFLKQEAEEGGLSCACDVVYVSRGGVLLLTVLPDTGNYDNPKIGPWRHRYINTRKEVVTLQKTNPFDTMAFFASVTEKLMMAENVLNPSVTRAVVFSADLVDFTTDYPECLTVGTLYDYVEAFNKRRHLNKEEYVKVCQALTACSDYLEDCLAASEKKKQAMKDQELLEATAARLANEKNEQFREEFAKTVVSGEDLALLKERKNAAPKKDALAKDVLVKDAPGEDESTEHAPTKDNVKEDTATREVALSDDDQN